MSVSIDGYLIDAFASEQPTRRNRVTSFPVEEGSDMSDHVIKQPLRLNVTGTVSNAPIGTVVDARQGDDKPSVEAYSRLVEIMTNNRLVTVITSKRPYDNMLLEALSDPTDGANDSLKFTASFRQIRTITINTEEKTTLVAIPRAQKKKKKAAKPSEVVDPPAPEVKAPSNPNGSSLLKKGLSWWPS